jgi:glycerol-3-phosphate O-acyltransferase/dihydroxyacetone phosphate acyltransferase
LRILVWFGLHVFLPAAPGVGAGKICASTGPAIVIANHPSTLMDPLNPALEIRQEMFFPGQLRVIPAPGKANWLLRRLYCIPVKRKEDVMAGELRDNLQAFEQSFEHMEKKRRTVYRRGRYQLDETGLCAR